MPKFSLGEVVVTPGVVEAFKKMGATRLIYTTLLHRHQSGDWGQLSEEDIEANNHAVEHGERILSSYIVGGEEAYNPGSPVKVWIITEWDRSVTTILLPEEY